MNHANVAVFVPHLGCPHCCAFCNQHLISGVQSAPTEQDVRRAAQTAAKSLGPACASAQIAFFGGSFTAIDREYMVRLLRTASELVRQYGFGGIRVSTRPDCVDEEILALLGSYGVTAVELGAQSMDDGVLRQNRRGHTAADVVFASGLIRGAGMELGLQMMTGLAGDTEKGAVETARRLAGLKPDCVRIYPTLVLAGTELAARAEREEYRPQTLEEAVSLCAGLLRLFEERKIPVIKLGLHASELLEGSLVSGPYHPAFRELCEGRIYRDTLTATLRGRPKGTYRVSVASGCVSKAAGHKGENRKCFGSMGYHLRFAGLDGISRYAVIAEPMEPKK